MTTVVDEPRIRRMVESFYGRVRRDPVLGPVFEERIGDWPPHLDKMVGFWSSALLKSGRYAGNPRAVHATLRGVDEHHFQRWLVLFEETLLEVLDPTTAASILARAQAMARGLLHGIKLQRDGLPMTAARKDAHRV